MVWIRNVESGTASEEWFECVVVEKQKDPISRFIEYRLETKRDKTPFQNGRWFPRGRLFDECDRNLAVG